MKKHLPTVLLALAFLVGLSLLLYPTISDSVNSLHQTKAITGYTAGVSDLSKEKHDKLWQKAVAYNTQLAKKANQWALSEPELQQYRNTLRLDDSAVMGYIEIPKLGCTLPIYHDVDDGTLQTSIGHVPGTSLPVGGASTHCVLSGHRGLPSAKLFSDLDRLAVGDQFTLHTLDALLLYEVDQILIVLPHESDALQIEEGKDYCTLVTCTPYGVNSHRLLVRGHRVSDADAAAPVHVPADATQIEPRIVAFFAAILFLLILLLCMLISKPRKKQSREDKPV